MDVEWTYKNVLDQIRKYEMLPPSTHAVIETIQVHGFDRKALEQTLAKHGVVNLSFHKETFLDLLLLYVGVILDDHAISEKEYEEFGLLKLLFKVKEGDFINKRFSQVKMLIFRHLDYILKDGEITVDESFTTANLQSMFGLTSEQYFQIREEYTVNKLTKP